MRAHRTAGFYFENIFNIKYSNFEYKNQIRIRVKDQ